ncbi:MAG: 23S rRNA (pseudouridine(1915)-N(3))-methyltransferase RlmH [Alphaproteobacteria bacterium]
MKVTVVSVGRVRQGFIREGEGEYLQRLKGSFPVEVCELGLEAPESMSAEEVREREAVDTLKRVQGYDYLVVLDERGKSISSQEFSKLIGARMNAGTRSLCCVIGGAFGFSEKVRQEADYILSLSALTLPHQLTRLVLLEQIYRAHTILRGIRYHK